MRLHVKQLLIRLLMSQGNSSLLPSFLPPGVAAAMCAVGKSNSDCTQCQHCSACPPACLNGSYAYSFCLAANDACVPSFCCKHCILLLLSEHSAGTAAGSAAAETAAAATTAVSTAADFITPVDPSTYVPGPVEVGWQIWFAAFVSTWPFVIGAYEFGKRIVSGCTAMV
jgi:hypothetical protein